MVPGCPLIDSKALESIIVMAPGKGQKSLKVNVQDSTFVVSKK